MSGPLPSEDVVDAPPGRGAGAGLVEITSSRETEIGGQRVRRALPRRQRRTVGPWCFADHIGPGSVDERNRLDVGPHPHIGLQTVTWLVSGELLHRDSLGSEQPIRPGQLNLMSAGRGVSHSEEGTGERDMMHGIQLWVAQPEATRHGEGAFEHHASMPSTELGAATATVLVGEFDGTVSPARRDTESVGVQLDLRGGATPVPLRPSHEHAVIVLDGEVTVAGGPVVPGQLCYLGTGRDEVAIATRERARLLLVGGSPFEDEIVMWWNFVARDRDEIDAARRAWADGDGRFGETGSPLTRIPAPETPWRR